MDLVPSRRPLPILGCIAIQFLLAGVASAGEIVAWGRNDHGQTEVPVDHNFVAVAGGDGTLVAWGDDQYSQENVPDGSDFVAIAAGDDHGLALEVLPGDMQCDGVIDVGDIAPFCLALIDPLAYGDSYPQCWINRADVDCSGAIDGSDLQPFIDKLLLP